MKKYFIRIWIIALTPVFFASGLSGEKPSEDNEWKLTVDKNDIKVYLKKVPGSQFQEARAITTIKTSLFSLLKLWDDVSSYPKWFHNCTEAKTLKAVSSFERYIYMVTDAPPPLKDRDNIIHVKITQDAKTRIVTIEMNADPGYLPGSEKYIRVARTRGALKLIPRPQGEIEVVFNFFLDPGGTVPAWLVNPFSKDFYYNTFSGMRKMVFQEKYQKAHYDNMLNTPE